MDGGQWARVKALFHAALAVDPDRRPAFLAEACAGLPEPDGLRAEVERLLAAHDQAESFIERSPARAFEPSHASRVSMTGRDVGHYHIGRLLGAGGMGEVYAARDTELGRDVAVKIASAGDRDSQLRLRREAQHASRLNHPQICTIHEVGSVDGYSFIVMELVEGPTLADRIALGSMSADEALAIARQLAGALDAAHAQGLVHRDLKPANVKLRPDGTIKVLDFGLAKTVADVGHTETTISLPLTEPGMMMGTAAYMAPEQVRGAPVDKRADIWAFGAVLYELLTAERAFRGENTADTLAAVLTAEPDWIKVPAPFRRLLRQCLERDPVRRLRDIGDALTLVDADASPRGATTSLRWGERWAWLAGTVALIAVALAASLYLRPATPAPVLDHVRFAIHPPEGHTLVPFGFAPSPDGRTVAFLAEERQTGRRTVWLYSLASGVSRALARLDVFNTNIPFWSPDSRFVALYGDGKLRSIDARSGAIQTVCEVAGRAIGHGSWNRDQVIVFAVTSEGGNEGLLKVPAGGGTPVLITRVDRSRELAHGNPIFLPDGRHFLYQGVTTTGPGDIYLGDLDVRPEEQSRAPITEFAGGRMLYSPSPDGSSGHLVFMRQGKLMSQAFDTRRLVPVGEATAVPDQPSHEIASREFGASPSVLAYRALTQPNGSLVWVDRHGREEGALGGRPLAGPDFPRLSPDGRRLALVLSGDIWIYDLDGKPPRRLTSGGMNFAPLWTPDGRRIVFETLTSLQSIAADGSEPSPRSASQSGHFHPYGWSADGSRLIALRFVGSAPILISLSASGDDESAPLLPPANTGDNGVAMSPDGRWLAFVSAATGRDEIWVQPYPGPGAPVRVSPNGGVDPIWARSGREFFYREGPRMMSVPVKSASGFEAQPAVPLFEGNYLRNGQPPSYDVAADGRFLMIKPTGETDAPISVILNWSETPGANR